MRKTEEAERYFKSAHSAALRMSGDPSLSLDLLAYQQFTAEGMALLAASIRDVYDELEAIHADIRAGLAGR